MGHAAKINFVPENVTLALYAGDGANILIKVKDPTGNAVPLDGTVEAQVRNERADTTALADFQIDLTDAATGQVRVWLTGVETAALINGEDPFSGFWDVQWTSPTAEPVTLVQGKATCTRDVTR